MASKRSAKEQDQTPDAASRLSALPKVDKVMRLPDVERLYADKDEGPIAGDAQARGGGLPRWAVLEAVRAEIARRRSALASNSADAGAPLDVGRIAAEAAELVRPTLRPVINATGVVLHTNLGRAPLPEAALQRIAELGGGYLTLEYRLDEGRRGSRQSHLAGLLSRVTGAESSLVVNNNAAAVLLMLAGLCAGREVVVSRGELVEIGGSFRVPDVMRASGARLREVGTTNRTHLFDYQTAISGETRALLKVHRSNFAIVGFTTEVPIAELCRCAHAANILCLYDLGSGALAGADAEPTIKEAIAAGCDVVTFSCDKLLGGPQAGVLCGSRAAIDPLRHHPLLRALRPDKLTLMALQATLELYRDGRLGDIPTLAMLNAPPALLRARAERLQTLCAASGLMVEVVRTQSAVGGGAMPLSAPESYAVATTCDAGQARRMEMALRLPASNGGGKADSISAVVARLVEHRLLCDVRTVSDRELPALAGALVAAAKKL